MIDDDEDQTDDNNKLIYILKELKKQLSDQQGDPENRRRTADLLHGIRQEADKSILSAKERRALRMAKNQQDDAEEDDGDQAPNADDDPDRPKT